MRTDGQAHAKLHAFCTHAGEVEQELRHVLHSTGTDDADGCDELRERRRTEPGEALAFVPVAADVAPQLALFGGGPSPPPTFTPYAAAPAPVGEPSVPVPAWQRRNDLRERRHSLVADLRRRDRRAFPEINRWLNQATGVRRVEEASVAQLERSMDLLLKELERRTARR